MTPPCHLLWTIHNGRFERGAFRSDLELVMPVVADGRSSMLKLENPDGREVYSRLESLILDHRDGKPVLHSGISSTLDPDGHYILSRSPVETVKESKVELVAKSTFEHGVIYLHRVTPGLFSIDGLGYRAAQGIVDRWETDEERANKLAFRDKMLGMLNALRARRGL